MASHPVLPVSLLEVPSPAPAKGSRRKMIGPDDFEVIKCIGKGDVGTVYLVSLKGSGDPPSLFAMKVLGKAEMRQRNKIKRVFTEREILSTTEHPFIVRLYYSFQTKENIYFVMEYCAGGEFFRTLQKQPEKRLPEVVAKFYASEVLLALEYLHSKNFIYRDLKPENILLHGSGHIMLTDFDLSKSGGITVNPNASSSVEPRFVTNSFVGTEDYLAPEVVNGSGHSGTVDWWTLGILIHEMLYGKTPFHGSSQRETFAKIQDGHLKLPKEPKVSKDAKDLIRCLLSSNPAKRLGSKNGAEDIKKHHWFKSVNFASPLDQTPPLVPKLSHSTDTRYFRAIKDTADRANLSSPSISTLDLGKNDDFRKFDDVIRGPTPNNYEEPDSDAIVISPRADGETTPHSGSAATTPRSDSASNTPRATDSEPASSSEPKSSHRSHRSKRSKGEEPDKEHRHRHRHRKHKEGEETDKKLSQSDRKHHHSKSSKKSKASMSLSVITPPPAN